jgi:hypothetical protein
MKNGLSRVALCFFLIFFFHGCVSKAPQPTRGFTSQELITKAYTTHKELTATLRSEEKSLSSLLLAVSATQSIVGDYSTLLTQSAQISSVTRFLPIPYAGEVSNSTKLIASSLATLNSATRDIDSYNKALKAYLDTVDQYSLNPTLEGLFALQEKGNTLLVKAHEMEVSLMKISHLLTTFSTLTHSIGSLLEKQQNLANDAKSLFGFTPNSPHDNLLCL